MKHPFILFFAIFFAMLIYINQDSQSDQATKNGSALLALIDAILWTLFICLK